MKFLLLATAAILAFFIPESGYAQMLGVGGGAFQSKLAGIRDALTGTILPLISTIGLVYAAILSITGSGEGRSKVVAVVVMSIVGFMARYIIEFIQGIAT